MFSKRIIDSDAFLEMPISAQCLYFHLSMRADDDGFINKPKAIMKIVGSSEDDIKILFAKKFVIPFESGVVVIKHWRINNFIRKDTYKPTNYQKELSQLEIKDNGGYTFRNELSENPLRPLRRLDKNRLDKNRLDICSNSYSNEHLNEQIEYSNEHLFEQFWTEYPKKQSKVTAKKSFEKLNPNEELLETMLKALEKFKSSQQWKKDNGQFIPLPATWLNQRRWEDEIAINDFDKEY